MTKFKLILFDMDETLYPRETTLMPTVTERITQFMIDQLDMTPEEAAQQRQIYREKYGTALRGLMEEKHLADMDGVNAYLEYVHDIPLVDVLEADPVAREMLMQLPLRRAILTNSNIEHAERVLNHLNLWDVFEGVIDIRAMNFFSKPDPRAYQAALDRFGVTAEETIFVEDTPVNTRPAKALGITTILLYHPLSDATNYAVPSLREALELVGEWAKS